MSSSQDEDPLASALEEIRVSENLPLSDGLRLAWPDLGRAWMVNWAKEFRRDLAKAEAGLTGAEAAGASEAGRTDLEHVFWRLASAREKLHVVVALAFAVPSLKIRRRRGLSFRPRIEDTRKKLRELATEQPAADAFLHEDDRVARSLILRHQLSHSLAPITDAHSLTWVEIGHIVRGGVGAYQAIYLTPEGTLEEADIAAESLFRRALRRGAESHQALSDAADALAKLVREVAMLQPPPIAWRVDETGELFFDRAQASEVSRDAAGVRSDIFGPLLDKDDQ